MTRRHSARYQNRVDRAFLRVYREDARVTQNSRCFYCHEILSSRTATADHLIARVNGGTNGRLNIVAACHCCNQAKGAMSPSQFKNMISSFPSGQSFEVIMSWSRRRINLALDRFERNINLFYGERNEFGYQEL